MARFITKQIKSRKIKRCFNNFSNQQITTQQDNEDIGIVEPYSSVVFENNEKTVKSEQVMTTAEKIEAAKEVLKPNVKRIKKDKGLIERAESNKTILTEDNKELLRD